MKFSPVRELKLDKIASLFAFLYLLGSISLKFPYLLTTDILRFLYIKPNLELGVLTWLTATSFLIIVGYIQSKETLRFFINCLMLVVGLGICQFHDSQVQIGSGWITFGLDWLIIDFAVTAAIFIPIEQFFPKRKTYGIVNSDWKLNLTYFLVFDLNIKFILFAIKFPAHFFFTNLKFSELQNVINNLPFLIALFLALFVADLFQFIRHFLAHKIPFLWKFHAVHHSTENIDWLAGSRSHLIDLLLDRSFIFIPIYILGFNESILVTYTTIVALQSVWAHTNSHIELGWLKYLIVTPQYHHWHHAKDVSAHDKNFAVHFPFIDMIFGTFHSFKHGWPKETGIHEPDFPKNNYLKQFLYPFKRSNR